ncbi:breast cancer metastasis-suppressor 1-like protein-A [Sinocyclocheilus grahami]|uniref:breast cancer metastasis-suppressor 1-like protein-A n=1 Tax=Sinocyclocheilus grahami TaxID=75366 RepID=UPI0007ACFF04|nr:PREDICTED: breast cancer metastasis-suppressor 1-like protein-A [Sinocyclocheilus grahami]
MINLNYICFEMPVHPRDRKENNHEEMDVDYPEQEASSSEEEDSVSSSVSEDGDTSDMDDEDCERRRMECLDEMTNLEKQFTDLKDHLYKERLTQVDLKLQEVIAGSALEYLEPLATLQENMQIRTKVAGIYRELCLESVRNKYDCEMQAASQHWEERIEMHDGTYVASDGLTLSNCD